MGVMHIYMLLPICVYTTLILKLCFKYVTQDKS